MKRGMNIMFTITKEEYKEISDLIAKYCCPCIGKNWNCAEVECDVQLIDDILWSHVEREDIEHGEDKISIEWSESEEESSYDEDELPFKK